MALREIRIEGDPILNKESKKVKELTPRTTELIEDMFETMYYHGGCGLAAPQVGVLKQVVVIDVEDGERYVLIDPEILETEGEELDYEGCLSVPDLRGQVRRAAKLKVRYKDEHFEDKEKECEGLLARCVQHEVDHLHGRLYTELVEGELVPLDELAEESEGEWDEG